MIKGILWDSDGVLVDTEHLFYEANRRLLLMHGVDLTPRQFLDWFLRDNCGAWHLLLEKAYAPEQIPLLREERNQIQENLLKQTQTFAIPGMLPLLARLAARLKMGIVTSATPEHFEIIHRDLGFLQHVEFALTDGSYARSKPAPDPYLLGLERIGLAAEECLVVEDSPRGLEAALAAGLRCIVVRSALSLDYPFPGAYRVVDDVPQLEQEILALMGDV